MASRNENAASARAATDIATPSAPIHAEFDSAASIRSAFERLDALFSDTAFGVASFTPDGALVGANDLTLQWLGWRRQDALGSLPIERFTSTAALAQAVRQGQAVNLEAQLLREDGVSVDVLVGSTPVRDIHGHLIMSRLWLHDLTERRRAEGSLQRSEANMARAQALTHFGHYEADLSHDIASAEFDWSDEFYRILGLDPKHGVLSTASFSTRFVHPDDRERFFSFVDACVSNRRGGVLEYRIVTAQGYVRHVRDVTEFIPAASERSERFFGVLQDVTELRQAQQQLRELTAHLLDVREEERTHLARELHDELGSALTAVKMYVAGTLEHAAEARGPSLLPPLRKALALLDEALESTRRITSDLRPSVLDYRGLGAALEWLAQNFRQSAGIECSLQFDAAILATLDTPEQRTGLFRIIQEALHNAVRHARAAHVSISARRIGTHAVIEIRDDGCGIAPQALAKPGCWGVIGMHERARSLGAELEIAGVPNAGTSVLLRMPLGANKPGHAAAH